jgi:hypothetical protein
MRSPLDIAVALASAFGGHPRRMPTNDDHPQTDDSPISVADAVEAGLGEAEGAPLLGVGADSEFEYVFPYSLFQGATDSSVEMVREQLNIRYGFTTPRNGSDDAGSREPAADDR